MYYYIYNTYTPMTQCLPAKDPPPIRLFSQVSRIAVDQQVVKAAPTGVADPIPHHPTISHHFLRAINKPPPTPLNQ